MGGSISPQLIVGNNGGGSPTVTLHFVESGGVLDATKVVGSASPADNANFSQLNPPSLYNAGDYLSIVSTINTAGTHARTTVLELDV